MISDKKKADVSKTQQLIPKQSTWIYSAIGKQKNIIIIYDFGVTCSFNLSSVSHQKLKGERKKKIWLHDVYISKKYKGLM